MSPQLSFFTHAASITLLVAIPGCGDSAGDGGGGAAATTDATNAVSGSGATTKTGAVTSASTNTASSATSSPTATTGGMFQSFAAMCAAPGVVFCDGFEGGFDDSWLEDGGDVRIVDGAAVPGEGASFVELVTYGSTQSSKLLRTFPDADRIHVRFDVQYDAAYDNSGGSHGLILGGSDAPPWGMLGTAGQQPNGSDFFVLNFEPDGVVGQDGQFGFYAYFMNMQPDGHGDYWGNVFTSTQASPPAITRGTWQCAEFALALNDPGSENGTASFWVDGVHHGTFDGFAWRGSPDLRISTFALDSYNHMNDGPIPEAQANRVRYDNLVISTEPVGCLD